MRRALAVLALAGVMVVPVAAVAQSPEPSLGPVVLQDACLSVAGGPMTDPLEIAQGILDGTVTVSFAPCPQVLGPGESPAASLTPSPSPLVTDVSAKSWTALKKSAKRIGYKALKRNPDSYAGKQVYLKGQVIQAQDDGEGGQFALVAVTKGAYGYWTNNVGQLHRQASHHRGRHRGVRDDGHR